MLSSPPAEWAALALPSDQLLEFRSSLLDSLASCSTSSPAYSDRRIELLCEIPSWSADCFDDLASCQDLRRRTLAALHGILDDLRARGLSPKYRLLTSSISFASIRLSSPPFPSSSSSPSCSDDEPFELSGKIDARGPARRTSAVLREELAKLEDARRLDERGETFVVFPTGRGRAAERAGGPTLVMT